MDFSVCMEVCVVFRLTLMQYFATVCKLCPSLDIYNCPSRVNSHHRGVNNAATPWLLGENLRYMLRLQYSKKIGYYISVDNTTMSNSVYIFKKQRVCNVHGKCM